MKKRYFLDLRMLIALLFANILEIALHTSFFASGIHCLLTQIF